MSISYVLVKKNLVLYASSSLYRKFFDTLLHAVRIDEVERFADLSVNRSAAAARAAAAPSQCAALASPKVRKRTSPIDAHWT